MRMPFSLVLVALLAPGATWAQQNVDMRRPAAKDGHVRIENAVGSVRVLGWDREEVAVSGRLCPEAERLSFGGGPQTTRVEVETRGNPHGCPADLEVHVPAASRLEIETFSAGVTVSEAAGTLRAESVNGSITVSGRLSEVHAESVSGGVDIATPATRIHAESVNGAVTVRGASGELHASTVNGRLEVAGGTFERGHLETVSGPLRFEGDLGSRSWVEIESVSGHVELILPATVGADFTLSTFSGAVVNELGPDAGRTGRHSPEKELSFTTGSGGARVSVRTVSGNISLRKR